MGMSLGHPIVRPNTSGRKPAEPRPGWRERLEAVRHVPRLLRLVWTSEPRYVVAILLLRIARSFIPLAVLWIGKLIVDDVVHAVRISGSARR